MVPICSAVILQSKISSKMCPGARLIPGWGSVWQSQRVQYFPWPLDKARRPPEMCDRGWEYSASPPPPSGRQQRYCYSPSCRKVNKSIVVLADRAESGWYLTTLLCWTGMNMLRVYQMFKKPHLVQSVLYPKPHMKINYAVCWCFSALFTTCAKNIFSISKTKPLSLCPEELQISAWC